MDDHVLVGAALFVLGVVNAALVWAIQTGRLRRNHFAGIRTQATMRDDDSWAAAHRAALPRLRWAAGMSVALAVVVWVVHEPWVPIVAWMPPVAEMIMAALVGNTAARSLQR